MQLWHYHAIDVGTVCCKEVHPSGALSQQPWMDVQFSVFQSVAICCCTVCLFVKKTAPRADQQARAPGGLDFSRVSLGAPLISKADKLSGILKRGKVATVLMARVTPSDLKPGVPP